MCELTENEKKVLADLKIELSDQELVNNITTANYLLSELELQFGTDVLNFVVGYMAGSLNYENNYGEQELPILVKAGELARDGYGEFHAEVLDLVAEMYGNKCIDPHSAEAKELTVAVNSLTDVGKRPWNQVYSDNVDKGLAKEVINGGADSETDKADV